MEWRFAVAKDRFDEVVDRALAEGPQFVHRGKDSVVVLAQRDYEGLTRAHPSFKQFLAGKGPSLEGLDLPRDRSATRDVKL